MTCASPSTWYFASKSAELGSPQDPSKYAKGSSWSYNATRIDLRTKHFDRPTSHHALFSIVWKLESLVRIPKNALIDFSAACSQTYLPNQTSPSLTTLHSHFESLPSPQIKQHYLEFSDIVYKLVFFLSKTSRQTTSKAQGQYLAKWVGSYCLANAIRIPENDISSPRLPNSNINRKILRSPFLQTSASSHTSVWSVEGCGPTSVRLGISSFSNRY